MLSPPPGLMIWYQMFEYAIGHWLQKSTEHMIGCVLCSPGCFSLFRGKALMDDNVMRRYTTKSSQARHYVQYDQGACACACAEPVRKLVAFVDLYFFLLSFSFFVGLVNTVQWLRKRTCNLFNFICPTWYIAVFTLFSLSILLCLLVSVFICS